MADVEASLDFYQRVFAPLGLHEMMRFPSGEGVVVGLAGPDGVPNFWLSPARRSEARELHVAFAAPDRAAVDAVHEAALSWSGGTACPTGVARVPPRLLRGVHA